MNHHCLLWAANEIGRRLEGSLSDQPPLKSTSPGENASRKDSSVIYHLLSPSFFQSFPMIKLFYFSGFGHSNRVTLFQGGFLTHRLPPQVKQAKMELVMWRKTVRNGPGQRSKVTRRNLACRVQSVLIQEILKTHKLKVLDESLGSRMD